MLCLETATDAAWIDVALRDIDSILADHAHCEMKAASSALSLAARHLNDAHIAHALTDLAREEIEHFQRVLGLLQKRGVALGPPAVDDYVASLQKRVQALPRDAQVPPLADRFLVAALIEARSCERFKILIAALRAHAATDSGSSELAALYEELMPTEARHFRTFVDLAVRTAGGDEARVRRRLSSLAHEEADVVRSLAAGTGRGTMHG